MAELCTDGPPNERKRCWLLKFDDPDRGFGLYDNEPEAMRAWDQAKDNWTCTLFVTAEFVRFRRADTKSGDGNAGTSQR